MPGMMDTILNLGLNDEIVEALDRGRRRRALRARRLPPPALDVRRRRPGRAARGLREGPAAARARRRAPRPTPSSPPRVAAPGRAASTCRLVESHGRPFPQEPREQLRGAIARRVRELEQPPGARVPPARTTSRSTWARRVNVQAMVFGNRGADCATGVAFTRNPATGEARVFGEYLVNAQGEDVVAGIRTPQPIDGGGRRRPGRRTSRRPPASCTRSAPGSSATSATCRTWSSRSSTTSLSCSRPAPASAPASAAVRIAGGHGGGGADRLAARRSAPGRARRTWSRCSRPASTPRRRRGRSPAGGFSPRGCRRGPARPAAGSP